MMHKRWDERAHKSHYFVRVLKIVFFVRYHARFVSYILSVSSMLWLTLSRSSCVLSIYFFFVHWNHSHIHRECVTMEMVSGSLLHSIHIQRICRCVSRTVWRLRVWWWYFVGLLWCIAVYLRSPPLNLGDLDSLTHYESSDYIRHWCRTDSLITSFISPHSRR